MIEKCLVIAAILMTIFTFILVVFVGILIVSTFIGDE